MSISYPYLHIARADDLKGKDRALYRFLEILPGALSWTTIGLMVVFSRLYPYGIAFFIIAFDFYWLIKSIYLSFHLRANWRRMQENLKTDWEERLNFLGQDPAPYRTSEAPNQRKSLARDEASSGSGWQRIRHLVILPFYKEDFSVIKETLEALRQAKYPKEKMLVVLAGEERAGEAAQITAEKLKTEYGKHFAAFEVTVHPQNLPGEMAGKGSNTSWAIEQARKKILDKNKIPYKDVLVSAFDIDTRVYPQYFLRLTHAFLTSDKPYRSSFQPVPLYNNNIWQAPALSRVVATSGTFWQMMQQERPERLVSFSSHSLSFKALYEIGYWQKNMVSEDSRIFWNGFVFYNGDYEMVPLSYPVSMDANLAPGFLRTAANVYKQQRRWTWGVENIPYLLFGFMKNKAIPLKKRVWLAFVQLEGFWSLATNPLMIFVLGWLPLVLGGEHFNQTLLSYNLPRMTRNLMNVAMLGLIVSAVISTKLLPPRPKKHGRKKYVSMILQWILIPFTIVVFGSLPGLDAQTRLMLGRYMGFWVTPKGRSKNNSPDYSK